jgi:hypothetical protein
LKNTLLFSVALLFFLAIPAGPARAADDATQVEEGDRLILGIGFTGIESFSQGESRPHFGGVNFVEGVLIRGKLELEIGVRALSAENGVEIPIDFLLKRPFHVSDRVTAYVGIGPALNISIENETAKRNEAGEVEIESGHTFVFGGFAAVTGAHFWVGKNFGFFGEVNYGWFDQHGASAWEIGGSTGIIVGF